MAELLADAGFVVVTLSHPHDASAWDKSWLIERPSDVARVLDYVLRSSPVASEIDRNRIGFFGFSRGGYTGLIAAGAVPTYSLWMSSWLYVSARVLRDDLPKHPISHESRFKAVVLADPLTLGFFPNKDSLQNVTASLQLWSSQLGGSGVTPEGVARLARDLPVRPESHLLPNSAHSSFSMPCSPAEAKLFEEACGDPTGFDRATFHRQFNAKVLEFFQRNMPAAS
jgi:predicted dienelactone hydrolase